jgi:preprotein translocase subunit YajC
MIGIVQAQETAVTTAQNSPSQGLFSFLPFLMIFAIFYFLLIRPQKKKMEEEQQMINTLKKGDEIFTKSGMLGTIVGMTEKVITLEVAEGIKLKVLRSTIGGLASKIFEQTESKNETKGQKKVPALAEKN